VAVAGGSSCATKIVTELLRTAPHRFRVVVLTSWDRRLSERRIEMSQTIELRSFNAGVNKGLSKNRLRAWLFLLPVRRYQWRKAFCASVFDFCSLA
jgi:hypothetical protein